MTKSVRPLDVHFSALYVDVRGASERFKQQFRVAIPIKWEASLGFFLCAPRNDHLFAFIGKVVSLAHVSNTEREKKVCTEPRKKVGTWLRDISSWTCLVFLPGPAWL